MRVMNDLTVQLFGFGGLQCICFLYKNDLTSTRTFLNWIGLASSKQCFSVLILVFQAEVGPQHGLLSL